MSYYLSDKLASLEDAVVADAYAEGMQGLGYVKGGSRGWSTAGDWKSPSASGASARNFDRAQQQYQNMAQQAAGARNTMGGPPRIIGGGAGDKVKGADGKWRNPTAADKAAQAAGTFDPKNTGGGGYTDSRGQRVGSQTKEGNAAAATTASAAWRADQSRQQDQAAAGWDRFAETKSGQQSARPQQAQPQQRVQSQQQQQTNWEKAGAGRTDGLPAWQTKNLRGFW